MNQRGLKFLAALLTTGIIVVPFMGLDNLPGGVRHQIESERQALTAARQRFERARRDGGAALPPDLVRTTDGGLRAAAADMAALAPLYEANRRRDRDRVEQLLGHERAQLSAAAGGSERLEKLAAIERDYRSARAVDLAPAVAAVARAGKDWPAKKDDLESRLAALRSLQSGLDAAYQAKDFDKVHAAAGLPAKAAELNALTGQLYESWDKVLVDLDRRRGEYRERVRTIRTREGKTASDENWVTVSRADFHADERNLGMSIARKPAGRYDSEAERIAQPAGFAYMAPPGQSNQYGRWEHRGGQSFWVWYGQYALLRDLLFNRGGYRPIERGDYESYRDYSRRGQTYYGRGPDEHPRYGTSAPETQNRYSGSKYAQSGGFRDSRYAAKGGYSGSKYRQPATPPRTFGSSRPAERPRFSTPRFSPRPSFGRSGGRSFGRRR